MRGVENPSGGCMPDGYSRQAVCVYLPSRLEEEEEEVWMCEQLVTE